MIFFTFCFVFVINRKGKKKAVEPEIKEDKPYLEERHVNSFIRETSEIKELVPLPPSIDLNEWIATNSKYCRHCDTHLTKSIKTSKILREHSECSCSFGFWLYMCNLRIQIYLVLARGGGQKRGKDSSILFDPIASFPKRTL